MIYLKWGTAVNVQAMVFGIWAMIVVPGLPLPGILLLEKTDIREYLVTHKQDVVAGIRTPEPLSKKAFKKSGGKKQFCETLMPDLYKELTDVFRKLESHYLDM